MTAKKYNQQHGVVDLDARDAAARAKAAARAEKRAQKSEQVLKKIHIPERKKMGWMDGWMDGWMPILRRF